MWRCPNCNEAVEDTFDICWNCGAAVDGEVDSEFEPQPNDPAVPDPGADLTEEVTEPPDADEARADASYDANAPAGMTRREIATLVCKSLALVLFAVSAALSLPFLLLLFLAVLEGGPGPLITFVMAIIPALATFLVGLFYWKKSDVIAPRMVSGDPRPTGVPRMTVEDIMVVAFSTVGLFLLVDGIRGFISVVLLAYQFEEFTAAEFWDYHVTWNAIISLLLAAWLIVGSRGFVRLFRWMRTAGIPQFDEQPERDDATEAAADPVDDQ